MRSQLPIVSAYTFTDYRSQEQMILYVVVDISNPLYRGLMPFNVYVALSRSRGRSTIQLLCDFKDDLFT